MEGREGLVEFENELVVVLLNAAPLVMGRRIPMVASRKYGFRKEVHWLGVGTLPSGSRLKETPVAGNGAEAIHHPCHGLSSMNVHAR